MSVIVPVMRFGDELDEAVAFYSQAFDNVTAEKLYHYPDDPETCEFLTQYPELAGHTLGAKMRFGNCHLFFIHAPISIDDDESISYIANFAGIDDPVIAARAQKTWENLCEGGEVILEFGSFAGGRYAGIVRDRFGVTWEVMNTIPDGKKRMFIVPSVAFGGKYQNQASEAVEFYSKVFPDHLIDQSLTYPEDDGLVTKNSILFCAMKVNGQCFVFQDAGVPTEMSIRRSTVFAVFCSSQEEIDTLWDVLCASEEPTGYPGVCTDPFGVNWLIAPEHGASLAQDGPTMDKLWRMEKIDSTVL